jgi:glycine/D-amino acid oxidase-like deaminating enzyme
VYPRSDGTVYVCGAGDKAPLPDNPANVRCDEAACRRLERVARRVCDRLTHVEEHSACYLPESQDGLGPLMGRLPGVGGAFVAAGHSCWGILQVLSVAFK